MFNLSASNNPVYLAFYRYLYKPKPGSIASFIDFFSKKNKYITVIQIGANDGFNHDPLHKFIKRDNWDGVLLEPQQDVFTEYLEKLHRKSPGIHTINAAIDKENGFKSIYKVSFSNSRWATGLTTFSKETLEKAVQTDNILKNAQKEGVKVPEKIEDRIKEEAIKTMSPEAILENYDIHKIDWLQIDTEGFDFEVIKMFNIPLTKPKVIFFEQFHLSERDKSECYKLLNQNNYFIKEYGRDTLAIHEPEPEYLNYLKA